MAKRFLAMASGLASLLVASTATAAGPTSEYFITDGDSRRLVVVQGSSIIRNWTLRDNTYPIAVVDTVRAYATYSNNTGSEYKLDGTYTGVDYPFQGDAGQSLDGATDATSRNWLVSFNDSYVWQFTRDWKNPRQLFRLPSTPTGITYDLKTGNFWIAHDQGVIEERKLDGTVLKSFSQGGGRVGCLAYEPATDTIWGVVNGRNTIRQYDKNGNILQSVEINGLASNNWGGEFAVPEPAALLMLALGAATALRRR